MVVRPAKGYLWNGTEWVKDEEVERLTLEQAKEAAVKLINDEAAKAYNSKTRFAEEYMIREAEARAFKANNYEGAVPRQIHAFTLPSGMDVVQATDLIISQADAYREAINVIGELRMRAYELKPLTKVFDVNEKAAQIVLAIRKVIANLD